MKCSLLLLFIFASSFTFLFSFACSHSFRTPFFVFSPLNDEDDGDGAYFPVYTVTTSGTPLTWDFPPPVFFMNPPDPLNQTPTYFRIWIWTYREIRFKGHFTQSEHAEKMVFVKLAQNNGLFLLILDNIVYPRSIFWSSVPLNAAKKIISFRIFNFLGHICRICWMILYVYWDYSEWICSYTENSGMNLFVY